MHSKDWLKLSLEIVFCVNEDGKDRTGFGFNLRVSFKTKLLLHLTLISYPPKWVKNKYISKCLKCSETNNALKKKLSPGHFCPGDN